MAYTRRPKARGRKRKPRRRTRKVYKRRTRQPMAMNMNRQVVRISKSQQLTGPSGEAGGTFPYNDPFITSSVNNYTEYASGAFSFGINQLIGYAVYQQIYDQYKITGIKLTFKYMNGTDMSVATNSAGGVTKIALMVYNDYDDIIAPPTTVTEWQSRVTTGRCKKALFPNRTNSLSYYFRPKVSDSVYDTAGVLNAMEVKPSGWIDFDTGAIARFYGIKWMIQSNPSTAITHRFRVTATYYVSFKDRKF